ncbi:MAG: hypothetical protein AAGH38_06435 [Pseudomonadota bacterium]
MDRRGRRDFVSGRWRLLLTAFSVVTVGLAGCATQPPDNPNNICAIFDQHRSWYRATRKSQYKWGTPKTLQMAIIRHESGYDDDAKPPRKKFLFIFPGKRISSAAGYAQALDLTWQTYIAATGNRGADRDNFKDASDFVGWYARETASRNGVPVTDAYRQYLAYHEGWGGFARGSFRSKPSVMAAARNVAAQEARYEQQLRTCEKRKKNGKTKFRP